MCRILMTLTICGLMSDSAQAQFATDRPGEQVRGFDGNALGQIQRDLQEARDLVKRLPATPNRDRLELLLTRVELSLKQLGSGGTARPVAITANDFNKLMFSLRNQAFDKDKYLCLENAMPGRHFSTDQATQLLKHFNFDNDRIRAAVLLYPQVIDQNNYHQVLSTFAFETSKKVVMEKIKNR